MTATDPGARLSRPISRRSFIRGVGGAVATTAIVPQLGWLAGCRPPTTKSTADWNGLAAQLHGHLLRPGDPSFAPNATPLNLRYADVQPQGVAVCSDAADVSACVRWAARNNVPLAVRSGGHSYAGYSSGPGLIIHVGEMAAVALDDATMTVTALPGARNTTIYDALQSHGVTISAGRCPTVAVGGLVLGGGIGFSSRKLGLTCDHLVEA
ncbi:MAG: FAD-binding oxidoreductase, partial [Acidimicrobiales bacterium]